MTILNFNQIELGSKWVDNYDETFIVTVESLNSYVEKNPVTEEVTFTSDEVRYSFICDDEQFVNQREYRQFQKLFTQV
jgi:hypothetical protein